MRRLCERPGCAALADVSYGIDKVGLTVWVDNRATSERELAGRLCRRHANALIVPRGWTLDDRRESIPRLFKALAEEVAAQETKPKRKVSKKREVQPESAPRPSLFESTDDDVVDQVMATTDQQPDETLSLAVPHDPDETQAIPWSPRLGTSTISDASNDEDSAPVFGRLLGRAFGQRQTSEEE